MIETISNNAIKSNTNSKPPTPIEDRKIQSKNQLS
jgi:hypothetical protein